MEQQQQPQTGGVPGPAGRRLHIAHRRSPSELTPLMSMFANPGMEQLAIQQQIELLQQQQQQIAQHQHYVQMGMMPPAPAVSAAGAFNPLQPTMANISPQTGFQFPNQLPQQNVSMAPPTQPLSHRRNQSALPNMGMGPPPAPSSGASGSAFGSFDNSQGHGRENSGASRGGRGGGGGGGPGGGHQRRHSLALADAKKAAELAQQKRTTSAFQFPGPGASGSAEKADEETKSTGYLQPVPDSQPQSQASSFRGGRGAAHGRSQSMAVGANGRGGPAGRGAMHFSSDSMGQGGDFSRRGGPQGHARTSSRNFDGNWRNQSQNQGQQDQGGVAGQPQGFQPGHRSRNSINQSISSIGAFQYAGQPQLVQIPGQMMIPGLYAGQQLNPMQLNQLQALQVAQMNGQHMAGLQASQHAPQIAAQQPQQQQQRKTLFTPYLPQATLPALLGDGQLVSGILRVNKKNRSDAYVSTQDGLLDADIFICGSKDRNRALEGDLVAVELLDVDEVWSQKREKEEKKKRKDITDTRSGSTNQGSANGDDNSAADGGLRRRGSLRQRPTQKKNDDVEVEGQSLLLVEEEEINDEQKPLYAGHIVAVIERVPGQMFSGTLGLLRPSSQATKEKQEAERAARDGSNNRHQDNRSQEKPKIVWFKPTDKRVPLIAIPTEQAPKDFVEKHQDYADQIFVACIKRWPITSLHPFGTLVEKLGRMGDLKIETDALLRDNNFGSDEFSDAVLRSVDLKDWTIAKEDEASIGARRDFRDEKVFTLDMDGSVELGNGVHVKSLPDGKIEIGIHVPDVTHFVKPNSLIDREAKKRGTAVHLVNRFCAMLPAKLSAEVCSLTPQEDRLTVSIVFHVNPHNGAVAEGGTWIGKGIVKSGGKLSLAEMDGVLTGSLEKFENESFTASDIQILNAVALKFREARLGAGGEPLAPLRLLQQIDDENIPIKHNLFDSSPATEMVEELMHKANAYVAQRLIQGLPEKALLRRQSPPNPRRLQTIVERMTALGYEMDASSSGTLQNSLFKVDDSDIRKGMETLLLKSMHRAKYYIAGKTAKQLWPHYALNLPLYTHFTCPTRRYADVVVHRQLESVLSDGKIEYTEELESLVKTIEGCNTKKDSAQNAQEQSIHIESCRIMDKKRQEVNGDLISEGIVICVYESAFDVLIPEWGFEKRVHCDQLPLKKAEFRKEKRVLELYWEKGVPSSAYVPEDERPKAAASVRMSNAMAAARQAEEAERIKKEREEAARKQTDTGTISTDDVDALFDDDEDNASDITEAMAGASLAERPTQSVPGSPSRSSSAAPGPLQRTRSDSKVPVTEVPEGRLTNKEKYLKLFKLREEGGEYIQDVTEMTRVPVILKTDLSKSPP
ncbi:RNB domain-containing protein [Diplogelasinospora grovesii]|uniref:RNB domain-containing protein n=1 Tax=Diplogelasinospora grovesii TaxID=303347 RepID=A0AAN6S9U8_9PEZI|nr:RNB domain-containing protein [Diplogelasinospora grovesii]